MKQLITNSIMHPIMNFFSWLWSFCTKYFMFFVLFLTPIHQFIFTVWIFLLLEFLTGLWKSYKLKEPITLERFRMLVILFVCYPAALYIGFQFDFTYFSVVSLYITKVIGIYITSVEFQGCIQNLSVITGIDIWSAVKDSVTNIFSSKIKELSKAAVKPEDKEDKDDNDGK